MNAAATRIQRDQDPSPRAIPALDGQVLRGVRTLVEKGMVVGSVGNVSARTGSTIRITPSRVPYRSLTVSDLVTVHTDGSVEASIHEPSKELPVHLAVYRERPDVAAVVHTHPPHSTAWSFLDRELEPTTEDNTYYGIGSVRTATWEPPGSVESGERIVTALGQSQAVLLGRHGLLTVANTVELALIRTEVVEHQAHVAWLLREETLGAPGAQS